jgi:hypothetical protein
VKSVHAQFLVGPVETGSEARVLRILQPTKVILHVLLRAIAGNNLFLGAIVAVIREQNGLGQKGGAQLLVSGLAKAERQAG